MPSSSVCTFTDPHEHPAAISGGILKIVTMGSGRFTRKIVRIDLHRLWMQRIFDNLPRGTHVTHMAGRAEILFHAEAGPNWFVRGFEVSPASIVRFHCADEHFHRAPDPRSDASMSLPVEDLISASMLMSQRDLASRQDTMLVTPPAAALARLRRLHSAAGCLAEEAPAVLAQWEAARGLEQALTEAMIHCIGGEPYEDRSAQRQHAAIMRRFHRVVEEHLDEPLYITELCKEVGASERTLNVCCHEHFSMGPKRYLLLRRMHMARRALQASTPGTTTVTEAATQYGFWQLGRFAVEYKALFGESPSATLARVE